MELEPTGRGLALSLATWQQRKASLVAEQPAARP
jgi:hypothetical protein